jgi:PAS domain S-box-containing protein
VEFISKLSESIASSIFTTQNTSKTAGLLEETQQMAEMMRAQEEEMRQNMEEMQATQDEMKRTQEEVRRKEYNLNALVNNTSDTIFAIDTKYNITVVNQTLADKYKGFGIELKAGLHIFDLLPKDKKEFWKKRYDRAMMGERYSIIEETSGSNGEKFSQTFHNPIKDENGEIIGVSVISRDVTDLVKAQKEVARKTAVMHSLIDNTQDTFFAVDRNYKILVANKALKDRFLKTNIVLNEGDNIFDKLPADQANVWKERYDRALQGESFVIPQERKVNDETLYIEGYYNPILSEDGEVIGASVMSRDVTIWKKALEEKATRESEIEKLKKAMGMPDVDSLEELIRRQAQADRSVNQKVKNS